MKKLIAPLILSSLVFLGGCYQVAPKYCQQLSVTDTEVIKVSETSHYRASFLDSDGQSFILTNMDDLLALKFNSGDVQAELNAAKNTGEKVWVNYYGWREPMISLYPNIETASRNVPCSP